MARCLTDLPFFVTLAAVFAVAEDVAHYGRSPADLGHNHVAVRSFGDVGGLVADGGYAAKPAASTRLPGGAEPRTVSVSPRCPTAVLAGQSRRSSAMLDLVPVQHARLVDELQRPPAVSRRPGAQSAAGRVSDHVRTERYRGGRRSAASTLRLDRFPGRHQLAVAGAGDPDVAAIRELQKLARPIAGHNEVTSPSPGNSGTFAICSGAASPHPPEMNRELIAPDTPVDRGSPASRRRASD